MPSGRKTLMSDKKIATLKKLWPTMSAVAIAERLSINAWVIRAAAKRLGLPPRRGKYKKDK